MSNTPPESSINPRFSSLTWSRVWTSLVPLLGVIGALFVSWSDLSSKVLETRTLAENNKEQIHDLKAEVSADVRDLKSDLANDIDGLKKSLDGSTKDLEQSVNQIRKMLYDDMKERSRPNYGRSDQKEY